MMSRTLLHAALVGTALSLWAPRSEVRAQTPDTLARPTLQATRTSAEIRVDGRLNEDAWQQAPVATDFVQSRPNPGKPASERTEARVLYDERAVYVAMRMYDRPDSIAAQLTRRDGVGGYSDWAQVVLDSYFDRRTSFSFGVNPRGVKLDGQQFNDTGDDLGWNAVWDVATQTDSLGWTAEFRIPLSQLRFRAGGEQSWGITFLRDIARREERSSWAPILPTRPGFVSQFGTLTGLVGLPAPRRLEISPYSVARLTRAPGDAADPFYQANEFRASVGADLQYGLSSNLTLTATINPDFGQVEADPAVVNLSAFETFFPEKRPFFQEGSEIFRFGFGGGANLFHSRRIGRQPQGRAPGEAAWVDAPEATTILGAAKLTGKTANGWSIGVLDAITGGEEARYITRTGEELRAHVEPRANYGVARVIKDFRGGQSALGAMLTTTHRDLPRDGSLSFLPSAAYTGGVDGRHRFRGGNYEVSGWVTGSNVRGSTGAIRRIQLAPGHYFQRPDAPHLSVDTTLTGLAGSAGTLSVGKIGGGHWTWQLRGYATSPGLEVNDLGFGHNADVAGTSATLGYNEFKPGPLFQRWNVYAGTGSGWSFGGEQTAFGYLYSGVNLQLKNFWSVATGAQYHTPYLSTSALRGGPALRLEANSGYHLQVSSDRRKRVNGNFGFGHYFDHDSDKCSLALFGSLSARPSPRATLSLGPSIFWSTSPEQYLARREVGGEPRYILGHLEQVTTSLTARLNYTFTPDLSLEFYAQPFVSAGAYPRFREVVDPRAERFSDRFRTLGEGDLVYDVENRRYRVDLDGDGQFETRFGNPDFNFRSLRGNAVLRWEYRPGSTLFLVWQQQRSGFEPFGDFQFGRDAGAIFREPARNVFLVKATYWIGS